MRCIGAGKQKDACRNKFQLSSNEMQHALGMGRTSFVCYFNSLLMRCRALLRCATLVNNTFQLSSNEMLPVLAETSIQASGFQLSSNEMHTHSKVCMVLNEFISTLF